mmetsp:Transcript_2496/g.5984  ORF Transcript_2496/g.5984 Transcript_2496/m.5984 type:complete len:207 (+) Transcript_2496:2890-3510(+)
MRSNSVFDMSKAQARDLLLHVVWVVGKRNEHSKHVTHLHCHVNSRLGEEGCNVGCQTKKMIVHHFTEIARLIVFHDHIPAISHNRKCRSDILQGLLQSLREVIPHPRPRSALFRQKIIAQCGPEHTKHDIFHHRHLAAFHAFTMVHWCQFGYLHIDACRGLNVLHNTRKHINKLCSLNRAVGETKERFQLIIVTHRRVNIGTYFCI